MLPAVRLLLSYYVQVVVFGFVSLLGIWLDQHHHWRVSLAPVVPVGVTDTIPTENG